jgi:hypothetical protein
MRSRHLRAPKQPWVVGFVALAISPGAMAGTTADEVRGYTGSATRGYTGSGVEQGYTGTAVRGYTGSGVLQGYTGSGVERGYTGSGVEQGYTGSGVERGYTGSGVEQGYTGSGVERGYTGTGVEQGYTGSGVERGYTGSGVEQGYTGSGVEQGYTGSGIERGYTGSGVEQGYTGTATRGYTGSGVVQGYTGSGIERGYTGSGIEQGYTGTAVRGGHENCQPFGDGFSVAAMGRIDSIALRGDAVNLVILGQAFEISSAAATGFVVGDFAVAGTDPTKGATAYHVGSVYVAGLSRVQLKAPVTAVDVNVGTAALGAATVDYTALLSADPAAAPEVGESFTAAGTQPVAQGVVLAGPSASGTVGCSALDGRM